MPFSLPISQTNLSLLTLLTHAQVVELLSSLTTAVKANEPGVFSFHLYKDFDRESGDEELVLVEKCVHSRLF